MADPVDSARPDDDVLVAYLDGELPPGERAALEARLASDASLRARRDALARGNRRFADAFDVLLAAAPGDRMQAKLSGLKTPAPRRTLRRFAALAAAIVLLVVGAAGGYLLPTLPFAPKPFEAKVQPNWRQAVAEYQAYLTADSMAVIHDDSTALDAELTAVGDKVSLNLSADKLAVTDADLKRVQLFDYWDRPLVQIAYLSADNGPISFCIIANGRPDQPPQYEQRGGLNIVFWTKDQRGYLVIGRAPRATLEALAAELAGRVG
jgi:anti-sigma factor RsiW